MQDQQGNKWYIVFPEMSMPYLWWKKIAFIFRRSLRFLWPTGSKCEITVCNQMTSDHAFCAFRSFLLPVPIIIITITSTVLPLVVLTFPLHRIWRERVNIDWGCLGRESRTAQDSLAATWLAAWVRQRRLGQQALGWNRHLVL